MWVHFTKPGRWSWCPSSTSSTGFRGGTTVIILEMCAEKNFRLKYNEYRYYKLQKPFELSSKYIFLFKVVTTPLQVILVIFQNYASGAALSSSWRLITLNYLCWNSKKWLYPIILSKCSISCTFHNLLAQTLKRKMAPNGLENGLEIQITKFLSMFNDYS